MYINTKTHRKLAKNMPANKTSAAATVVAVSRMTKNAVSVLCSQCPILCTGTQQATLPCHKCPFTFVNKHFASSWVWQTAKPQKT